METSHSLLVRYTGYQHLYTESMRLDRISPWRHSVGEIQRFLLLPQLNKCHRVNGNWLSEKRGVKLLAFGRVASLCKYGQTELPPSNTNCIPRKTYRRLPPHIPPKTRLLQKDRNLNLTSTSSMYWCVTRALKVQPKPKSSKSSCCHGAAWWFQHNRTGAPGACCQANWDRLKALFESCNRS